MYLGNAGTSVPITYVVSAYRSGGLVEQCTISAYRYGYGSSSSSSSSSSSRSNMYYSLAAASVFVTVAAWTIRKRRRQVAVIVLGDNDDEHNEVHAKKATVSDQEGGHACDFVEMTTAASRGVAA